MNYEFHEYAAVVPLMDEAALSSLAADIKANGLREPVRIFEGKILDGRNRSLACKRAGIEPSYEMFSGSHEEALKLVVSLNLERRHLDEGQRAMAGARLKPMFEALAKERQEASRAKPGEQVPQVRANLPGPSVEHRSRDDAARAVNVSPRSVENASRVIKSGDHSLIAAVDSGKVAVSTAAAIAEAPKEEQRAIVSLSPREIISEANRLKRETKQARQEARKAEAVVLAAAVPQVSDRYRFIVSSIETLPGQIEHASVDWVITDPPYPREYVNLYGHLSMLAEAALKPGGSLLAMAGQSYLPEVMDQLATSLRYHWTLAYLTPGGQAPHLFDRKVNTFWKPILWYTKGQYPGATVGDVVKSAVNDNDKRFHHWGQSESGLADLIERFTKPGDLILDPFVGGGSTAFVAVKLGRRFIGADISEEAVTMTRARLAEAA